MIDYNKIILDSIADGVFTIDMNFQITFINQAARRILGLEEGEALGEFCSDVFHADICEHSCVLRETMASGNNIINKSVIIVNPDGDRIPISVSTALLKNEEGEIIGGVETFRDISEVEELRKAIENSYDFEDMVSKNYLMQEMFSILPDIAESDSSVLIDGPSGTGKELVARALHNLSSRRGKPMVVINCGALPDNLIESELFGYMAGAFTDAKKDKPGKITLAEGGTLFLDEVGELAPAVQVKLLRFLQERVYEPLGGIDTRSADVRIIAATNKDLLAATEKGAFREDLYYRLNIINVSLPPLKERLEDVPPLTGHFIRHFNVLKKKKIEGVSDDVMNILLAHDYPGNIRELENIIEHAFVLCKEFNIQVSCLPKYLQPAEEAVVGHLTLDEMERVHIFRTLERNDWNRKTSAEVLGIDASTLWRKIKRYNLED